MNKVQVSQEVADALDYLTKHFKKEIIVKSHAEKPNGWVNSHKALNLIDLDILIRALYFGYSVGQPPEEIILENFKKAEWIVDTEEDDRNAPLINEGYLKGTKDTLDTLGIKIKGVNC
ncbi:hypothetical protein V4V34_09075 [Lysinibacillus sphaericus]|uniref:hypothetical protein n=1 Tax=Lysinibacillus sphaericus TaxID=1421 RepID=UPI002FBDCE07